MKPSRYCKGVDVQDVVPFHEGILKLVDAHEERQGGRSLEDSFGKVFVVLDEAWLGEYIQQISILDSNQHISFWPVLTVGAQFIDALSRGR